jgi:hypothetical protein
MGFIGNNKPKGNVAPKSTVAKGIGVGKYILPGVSITKGVPAALKKPAAPKGAPKGNAAKKPKSTTPPADTNKKDNIKKLLELGIQDQAKINALEGGLATQKALRKYQEDASRLDLQANLKTIDRNALDLYKGVSDNYAGRGMLRSGGYTAADDKAKLAVDEEKASLNRAMEELQRTNEYQNLIDQEDVNAGVADIKSGAISEQMQEAMANITNPTNTTGAKNTPKKKPKKKKK